MGIDEVTAATALSVRHNGPVPHCRIPATTAAPVHTTMDFTSQKISCGGARWVASNLLTAGPDP
ncbi:hypothetical protein I550_1902 [Mycobacterium intracellulare 1956]|uniref:Uncharacterized protein n=1 Tax=Mycobacterium intracellulare 1956 TaxID=1299331 RepID=X8CRU8_MYCIT|nr:hypothetical protein I550_1902 [Mycobacterium intracellulare 1956]